MTPIKYRKSIMGEKRKKWGKAFQKTKYMGILFFEMGSMLQTKNSIVEGAL